jgi:hypothetical protein
MTKEFKLTPAHIAITEIFIDNIGMIQVLRDGLYLLVLEYLERNINSGVDDRISGEFVKDFNNLLEFLYALEDIV